MRETDFTVDIPENICSWLRRQDGANVSVIFNSSSANCGYGHRILKYVAISRLTRTCVRCGYDPLWNPDDSESKCVRHTYNPWRYDDVFVWEDGTNANPLEADFSRWMDAQPERSDKPVVTMICGNLGTGKFRRQVP